MHCEGCEYALAKHLNDKDPSSFEHVLQFAFEIRFAPFFIRDGSTMEAGDNLPAYVFDAGLRLQAIRFSNCGESKTSWRDSWLEGVIV